MTAASRPRRSANSGSNWRQIVAQYQNPDVRHSVGQILTSLVPYFALLILMYFSLSVSYWLTLLLAIPAALRLISAYRHQPPANCPPGYPDGVWPRWYSAIAFAHTRNFGALFLLAMLTGWLVMR